MTKLRNVFGTTPIDTDEIVGLIPKHITTQTELNEWEQANIVEAELWLNNRMPRCKEILEITFIKKLHQKMFGSTWCWAGKFRQTNKNIGVDWHLTPILLKQLFDNVHFQLLHETYSIDEIAARLHHKLVFIHPFNNGNGRLSRLETDIFLLSQKQSRFSWGINNLNNPKDIRKKYISALKAADKYDYSLLLNFVRS